LFLVLLYLYLQLLERPPIPLSHKLPGCSHVSLGEKKPTEPHTTFLVIVCIDKFVKLLKSPLKVNDVIGEIDIGIDSKIDPRFRHNIGMDILSKSPQ
jgi:hypothetical protein